MERTKSNGAKTKYVDTTEGVIWKQIIVFFIPVFLSSIFQQVYNMVDVWFVGNYIGSDAIAAIGGSTCILINLILGIFNGFSTAITVLIAQRFGAKRHDEIKRIIFNALILCSAIGAAFGIIGICYAVPILKMIAVPVDSLDMAAIYLRIYFAGLAAIFIYNISAGMLRALGDSKRPLYCLYLCCAVNIVLDYILIVIFHRGVEGAAVATLCAQCLSALLNVCFLLNRKSRYRMNRQDISLNQDLIKKILVMGIPAAIQNMVYSAANLIVQSVINTFGTDTVAAVSVYYKVDMLCWWAMTAFGYALTTFVGQNYGAGKMERIKKGVRISLIMALLTEILFSVILVCNAQRYFQFFTSDSDVIAIGISLVMHISPFYFSYVCIDPLVGAIKGTGNTFVPMMITIFGICILRITWVEVVSHLHGSFLQMMLNFPVTWALTSLMFVVYYASGRWLKKPEKEVGSL